MRTVVFSAMASACLSSLTASSSSSAAARFKLLSIRRQLHLLRAVSVSPPPVYSSPVSSPVFLCPSSSPRLPSPIAVPLLRKYCVSPQFQATNSEVSDVSVDGSTQNDQASSSPERDPDDMKLYVGNLPNSCTDETLKAEFSKAGHVDEVEVLRERRTGKSCGFGFVTMGTVEEAEAAIQMFEGKAGVFPVIDENDHDGRPLKVIFAMRPMNAGPPPPQFDDNANKLFVGNLAWGVDQSVLEQAFGKYGKVMECKVVTDRETGRSRGFGFVTMSTEAEANEALTRLNGANVQGRNLRVNMAGDRPPPRAGF